MTSRPLRSELHRAPAAAVETRPLSAPEETEWRRFAMSLPEATLFHSLEWRDAVSVTYPFRPRYIGAWRGSELTGILPLFSVKNPFTRQVLISVPFGVYGGAVATDRETRELLAGTAAELALTEQAAYCELRHQELLGAEGFAAKDGYATFVRELPRDPDRCLLELPRKARAAARQAQERHGLETTTGVDQLPDFYRLFVHNKRHLGSPVLPLRFFEALIDELGDRVGILLVRREGEALAGVVTFFHRDVVMPYYSGSLHEHEGLQINNFMYLRLMEEGVRLGYRRFDFGRSRVDSGSYRFKKNQGFEPRPLHYEYHLAAAREIPDLTPSNPRFRFAEEIWKHMPSLLVRKVGPFLIRYFA
jgi:FemAB-related protein (PEP-CTERM system-associated)